MISWKVKLSLLLTSVVAVFIFLLTATYTTLIIYADLFENPHVYQIALVLSITVFGNILFRSAYVYYRLLSISALAQLLFVEFNYRSAMLLDSQEGFTIGKIKFRHLRVSPAWFLSTYKLWFWNTPTYLSYAGQLFAWSYDPEKIISGASLVGKTPTKIYNLDSIEFKFVKDVDTQSLTALGFNTFRFIVEANLNDVVPYTSWLIGYDVRCGTYIRREAV